MNLDPGERRVVDLLRSQNKGRVWASPVWLMNQLLPTVPTVVELTAEMSDQDQKRRRAQQQARVIQTTNRELSRILSRLTDRKILLKRRTADGGVVYGIAGLAPESPEVDHGLILAAESEVGIRGRDFRLGWGYE